jgi:hypothetical protein
MPNKRTDPTFGLPYRSADETDVRQTWDAAIHAQVPLLRACELCLHSVQRADGRHCQCPAVRMVNGLQPVHIVRGAGEACGPGAHHLDMASWSSK